MYAKDRLLLTRAVCYVLNSNLSKYYVTTVFILFIFFLFQSVRNLLGKDIRRQLRKETSQSISIVLSYLLERKHSKLQVVLRNRRGRTVLALQVCTANNKIIKWSFLIYIQPNHTSCPLNNLQYLKTRPKEKQKETQELS